jgi:UDP-perosamine 4-acetyltransferase
LKKVIVIGSGGHAKMVIDILHEMKGLQIIGITSKTMVKNSIFCGYPVLGTDDILRTYVGDVNCYAAMGLGGFKDNKLREALFIHIKSIGFRFINIIHPSSIISNKAVLGEGVMIFPGAIINTEVSIGDNAIIATGASIDHESIIEEHVLISAGVTVGAYSTIKKGALLALGSKVVSGIIVGEETLVAAGAVVVSNIPDRQKVYGVPARSK